jgi:hypothetical protein
MGHHELNPTETVIMLYPIVDGIPALIATCGRNSQN